jgi:4-aminobutyrate aminotransferase-like enzyme
LATTLGLEVMNMLEEDYEKRVSESGRYFLALLQDIKRKHTEVGDVDGLGLALRMEICRPDGFTPDRDLTERIFVEGLKGTLSCNGSRCGLILDIGGYHKNVLTLSPSLHITENEMQTASDLLDQLLTRCTKS